MEWTLEDVEDTSRLYSESFFIPRNKREGHQAGDVVEFEPRHIAQTVLRKGDPLWVEVGEKIALSPKMPAARKLRPLDVPDACNPGRGQRLAAFCRR